MRSNRRRSIQFNLKVMLEKHRITKRLRHVQQKKQKHKFYPEFGLEVYLLSLDRRNANRCVRAWVG